MKTRIPLPSLKAAALALCLGAASLASAPAAAISWNSLNDGNWADLPNWSGAGWVPGSDFPANVDAVTLGSGGFLPFSGLQAQTRTITLGTGEVYTVGSLTFSPGALASPQNYRITGPGKLVFDSGSQAPATLVFGRIYRVEKSGNNPIIFTIDHEIASNIEVHGTLDVTIPSDGHARAPILSGSITGNGTDPVQLNVKGGGNAAKLSLASTNNDFKGGEVNLVGSGGITINANSLKGAVLRFSGTDSLTNKVVSLSGISTTSTIDFTRMIVESNGVILALPSQLNLTLDWQSTEIAAGKTLLVQGGANSTFRIAGSGKTLSLGKDALLTVEQSNGTRSNIVSIETGAILEGRGSITTRRSGTGTHQFRIGSGGIVDPGLGTGSIGTLTFGSIADNTTNIIFKDGSTLRMQLNGLNAGVNHDQIAVDAGNFTLEGTGAGVTLSLSVGYWYQPEDEITLISVAGTDTAPGVLFTGTFAGLEEGALVNMGFWGGNPATAQISYLGGDGNDVILYNFSVVPEPGTYALAGLGLATLLLRRRRRAARA